MSAVTALARAELRRRWWALVLLGLLAGAVGAAATSAVALARRTTTAYDRLEVATGADDARGMVLAHPDLVDQILDLPQVAEGWEGGIGIAKLDDEFNFLGVTAGPAEPSSLLRPIVLDGRPPGPSDEPDVIEITLREDFQRAFRIPLGTEVPVRFLTEDDYYRFDTGFEGGEPHGPQHRLRVVGTVRLAGSESTLPPAFASPEALAAHPDAFLGRSWFARLDGGDAALDRFRADVARLADGLTLPPKRRSSRSSASTAPPRRPQPSTTPPCSWGGPFSPWRPPSRWSARSPSPRPWPATTAPTPPTARWRGRWG